MRQPSLCVDVDLEAALRRAMELEQACRAENFIKDMAVQFICQQASAVFSIQQGDMQPVLADPLSEPEDVPLRSMFFFIMLS